MTSQSLTRRTFLKRASGLMALPLLQGLAGCAALTNPTLIALLGSFAASTGSAIAANIFNQWYNGQTSSVRSELTKINKFMATGEFTDFTESTVYANNHIDVWFYPVKRPNSPHICVAAFGRVPSFVFEGPTVFAISQVVNDWKAEYGSDENLAAQGLIPIASYSELDGQMGYPVQKEYKTSIGSLAFDYRVNQVGRAAGVMDVSVKNYKGEHLLKKTYTVPDMA